jgi:cation transport regulator ChaC
MLMARLFAYGSLISPASASISLAREITSADMIRAELHDFERSWTAAAEVFVKTPNEIRAVTALFLDLTVKPDAQCNGVVIDVTDADLKRLDVRERGYERMLVNVVVSESQEIAWTYFVPPEHKSTDGVILQSYLDMVEQALRDFPGDFVKEFWNTTLVSNAPIIPGQYTFNDSEQNRMTGR